MKDEGSKLEVPSQIAQITDDLTKVKLIWNDRLNSSLVITIFLDVTAELKK